MFDFETKRSDFKIRLLDFKIKLKLKTKILIMSNIKFNGYRHKNNENY